MKQIVSGGRLLLRKILTGLSLGAVSFIFAACYGLPYESLTGTVRAADTEEPIPGIQVLQTHNGTSYNVHKTDIQGRFTVSYEGGIPDTTLLFQDIDGPLNGEFENKEVLVMADSKHIDITMDRIVNAQED